MFSGSIPALPTPFSSNGIDEAALRDHVSWLIEQGSAGMAACGTTGEGGSLSVQEHLQVIQACVSEANGRVPVIAGCGTQSTATTLEYVRQARDAGAAAAMVVAPYYIRPGKEGVLAHFRVLAEHGGLPIVLYNVPARTGTDILPGTMGKLVAERPDVFVAVKDATGLVARVSDQREACGPGFTQLSGSDETALGFMATGGRGCISVTASVAPRLCAEFQQACRNLDFRHALQLHERLMPLHRALFAEPSPGPLKYALSTVRAGYSAAMRLPLVNISATSQRMIDVAMRNADGQCEAHSEALLQIRHRNVVSR